jgi:hypothetical protein
VLQNYLKIQNSVLNAVLKLKLLKNLKLQFQKKLPALNAVKKLSSGTKFCTDCGSRIGPPKKKFHDDEVDKLIKEVKYTGK